MVDSGVELCAGIGRRFRGREWCEREKVELSGPAVAALRLAAADFEGLVAAERDAGLNRKMQDYRAVFVFRDGGIEISFIAKIDETVGGGAQYWFRPPFTKIEKRLRSK